MPPNTYVSEGGAVVYERKSAIVSADAIYRYALERVWSERLPMLVVVGLNPSTADGDVDDNTIRKVVGFSRRWGFGGIVMTNLYAFRSKDPNVMKKAIREKGLRYAIGETNDHVLSRCFSKHENVWFAWGAQGCPARASQVLALAHAHGREPYCIGTSVEGAPLHPLRQSYKSVRRPWYLLGGA